jgi:cytochrome c oxidase subunit 3
MSETRPIRIVGSLSGLSDTARGPESLLWWGNVGFMLIEGTAFALAAGAYLYLQSRTAGWPPPGDRPPDLLWGSIFTVGLLASLVPNLWVSARAKAKDARRVRIGVVVMAAIGVALLALRGFEFAHLNVRWDHDAYGSVVWLLMVLHTSHVITDLGETFVQGAWLHTHVIGDNQFADVEDAANYWNFVIVAWLPIYALVYLWPRLV